MSDQHISSLDALLSPRAVAIVGASSDERRFGGRPIQYLKQAGFPGPIYPVNPGRETLQGLRCFPSVAAIEGVVDCALLAVGAEVSVSALQACADKGVKAAIVLSAGFAEIGGEGLSRQAEMVEIARKAGMRLLGPNCMGAFNAAARFYGTFASALEEEIPEAGHIGLVSQSGGYGGYILRHALLRGLRLGAWVTSGNECDVEAGELIHWMAGRAEIDLILAYLEGARSGPNLIKGLDLARRKRKPVIALKVGRTVEGRAAAASHTAALTGEDAVYQAVFDRYGVYRARTSEELLDVAYAASRGRFPTGRRVGVISMSGGVGVQISDYVSDAQLDLAPVPKETRAALKALIPFCSPTNPIDATGQVTADHHLMGKVIEAVLAPGAFDAILIFIGIAGSAPSMAEPLRRAISEACAKYPGQMAILSVTAPPQMVRDYNEAGFLVFEDPARAVQALAALARFRETFEAPLAPPPAASECLTLPASRRLNEVEAKAFLAKCGIRTPRERLVQNADEAAAAAREIGFPVAVKIVSADILHKTEAGGVALDLGTPETVREAVMRMATGVPAKKPEARIDGYLVSEMVKGGVETLIGVSTDPVFGPVVTFGLGGVLVELLKDVTCRLAPVTKEEARRMMETLKGYPLLAGYRGGPAHDVEALADAIAALSSQAAALPGQVRSIEVNPAVVMPGRDGVVALDAVIERA